MGLFPSRKICWKANYTYMKLLIIMGIAFGVMFGIISPKKGFKKIGMLLLIPLVILLGWNILFEFWKRQPILEQTVLLIGGIIIVPIILLIGTKTGRKMLTEAGGHLLYDLIKSIFRLPSKIIRLIQKR